LPIGLIGGAISGVSSLIGGIMGNNAAGNAAATQAAAGKAAVNQTQGQQTNALAAQNNATQQQTANQQPFIGAGQAAIGSLSSALGPGGQLSSNYGSFTAPTGVTEQNDPGYQFRLQQGQNAIQNSAAASGGLLSTGTAKTLNDYAQGQASNEYSNVYNRALQTYGTNFNTFNTNNNNLYNRQMGIAALGQNSAGALNSNLQAGAQNQGQIDMTTGQLVGNDLMGIGNAQAAGTIGGTNALTSGIAGGANSLSQALTLQQILGAQNASSNNNGNGPTSALWGGS
jgi:hypothetical protein